MCEQPSQITAQQADNTANIADLITRSGNLLRAVQGNAEKMRASQKAKSYESLVDIDLFNLLIAEMRADRQAFQQRFNDLEQAG